MNTAAAALLAWAYGEAGPGPDDQRPTSDEDYGFLQMGAKSVVVFPKKGDSDPDLKSEYHATVWHAELCISGGVRIARATGGTPEEALSELSDAWITLHKTMMEKAPLPHGLVLPVGQEIAAVPRTYLPAAPSPEADRQIAEIRAIYAAYRNGGRVGKIDITAASGYFLPERAGDMHSKAPLWVGVLLREIDELRAPPRLDWKPWYPKGADTTQPPGCYVAETGELRAEAMRTMNSGAPDGEQWYWSISFIASPNADGKDEDAFTLREAGPMLASAGLARQEAEAAYAKLMGHNSTTREKV